MQAYDHNRVGFTLKSRPVGSRLQQYEQQCEQRDWNVRWNLLEERKSLSALSKFQSNDIIPPWRSFLRSELEHFRPSPQQINMLEN